VESTSHWVVRQTAVGQCRKVYRHLLHDAVQAKSSFFAWQEFFQRKIKKKGNAVCGPAVQLCGPISPIPPAVSGNGGNPSFLFQWSHLGCGTGRNAFRRTWYAGGFPAKHLFVVGTGPAFPTVINGQMRCAPPGRIQSDVGICLPDRWNRREATDQGKRRGGSGVLSRACHPISLWPAGRDSCRPTLNNSIPAPRGTTVKPVPLQNTSPETKR